MLICTFRGRLIQDVAFAYLSRGFLILFTVAFLPLGVILALVGRSTYKRGKKLAAAADADLILRDPRPPILYLRSFKDDSKTARSGSLGIMNWLLATATEEEQFAEAMGELDVPMRRPSSDCSIVVTKRSKAREAKGADHPRWD